MTTQNHTYHFPSPVSERPDDWCFDNSFKLILSDHIKGDSTVRKDFDLAGYMLSLSVLNDKLN